MPTADDLSGGPHLQPLKGARDLLMLENLESS
jgi:hypothetical protein